MRGRRSKERELWEDMERERHNGGLLARRSGEEIDRGWMWRGRRREQQYVQSKAWRPQRIVIFSRAIPKE